VELNYLLSLKDIDTSRERVLVMRHVPKEPGFRKILPWLAAEKPEIFNAYQQSQRPRVEKQLTQATHVVSCIGHRAREALFIGLYRVTGFQPITWQQFREIPGNIELHRLEMKYWVQDSLLWFELELTSEYQEWKGKLIFGWPGSDRAWTRWADKNKFSVKAILEESKLDKGMPSWDNLVLTWGEISNLPKSWVDVLSEWRGIYFILDATDGKGDVGSAYGDENLYGRWKNYAASGDGGNKLLLGRAPDMFQFSILQRVSPDMESREVIDLENSWKERLHTREFGLNLN